MVGYEAQCDFLFYFICLYVHHFSTSQWILRDSEKMVTIDRAVSMESWGRCVSRVSLGKWRGNIFKKQE